MNDIDIKELSQSLLKMAQRQEKEASLNTLKAYYEGKQDTYQSILTRIIDDGSDINIKDVLIASYKLTSKKKFKDTIKNNKEYCEGKLDAITSILKYKISKEELNKMMKINSNLVSQVVRLDDIANIQRGGTAEEIRNIINALEHGSAVKLDPTKVKYSTLSVNISKMKKNKTISADIKLIKRKDDIYLAKP